MFIHMCKYWNIYENLNSKQAQIAVDAGELVWKMQGKKNYMQIILHV